jgi:hypothetical protein
MKTAVFWDVAPCSLVDIDLHIDAGGSKLLWNVRQYLPNYAAQHPRR